MQKIKNPIAKSAKSADNRAVKKYERVIESTTATTLIE